jgi:hypothetical protein
MLTMIDHNKVIKVSWVLNLAGLSSYIPSSPYGSLLWLIAHPSSAMHSITPQRLGVTHRTKGYGTTSLMMHQTGPSMVRDSRSDEICAFESDVFEEKK